MLILSTRSMAATQSKRLIYVLTALYRLRHVISIIQSNNVVIFMIAHYSNICGKNTG
jgi:hypothetical protein